MFGSLVASFRGPDVIIRAVFLSVHSAGIRPVLHARLVDQRRSALERDACRPIRPDQVSGCGQCGCSAAAGVGRPALSASLPPAQQAG